MTDHIVGLVLAGGLATRMGGADKGLLELRPDWRLLDEVLQRLEPQVERIAINANGDPARLQSFGLPVLPDGVEGYAGPLAGVLTGLDWAAGQGATHVVSVAADTPFFPTDLVSRLKEAVGPEGVALAATKEFDGKVWNQPTFGLWPVSLREDLRRALVEEGLRKIVLWTKKHQAGQAMYDLSQLGFDPFFNVNTPEDLVEAKRIAQEGT